MLRLVKQRGGVKYREIKEYLQGDSVGAARVLVVVDGEWLYLI